jgi:hypothetical protein
MRRREYLQAAAVVLGVGTAASGSALATHDDPSEDVYDVTHRKFDDVTEFRAPTRQEHNDRRYVRIYDADSETVAYATTVDHGTGVALRMRDASDTPLSA